MSPWPEWGAEGRVTSTSGDLPLQQYLIRLKLYPRRQHILYNFLSPFSLKKKEKKSLLILVQKTWANYFSIFLNKVSFLTFFQLEN